MRTQTVTVNRTIASPAGFPSGFHNRKWRIICKPIE
jgi:hypothetical protein